MVILSLCLHNVCITLVCLWVCTLGQCCDEISLEGDDVLGCWLSEWFPLSQQGLDLVEVAGASSHTAGVLFVVLLVGYLEYGGLSCQFALEILWDP